MGAGNTTEEFFDGLVGWVRVRMKDEERKWFGVHHKLEIDSRGATSGETFVVTN